MQSGCKLAFPQSRGSIIIFILGVIVLVSALLARLVERIGTEVVVTKRTSAQSLLRSESYSALETTLAVLAEFNLVDGGLFSPAQGWGDPMGHAGFTPTPGITIEVGFVDETGKLSLPRATPEEFRILLESSGVESDRARVAAEAFFSRGGTDGGHGTPRPAQVIRTYGEMLSIEALREVLVDASGRPNAAWGRMEQAITLHHHSATNLNTATPGTLRAMGWTEERIAALEDARRNRGPNGYAGAVESLVPGADGAADTGMVGTRIEVLRIMVVARSGDLTSRLEAVVSPRFTPGGGAGAPTAPGDLQYPFQVLEFRENPDAAPVGGQTAL